MNYVTEKNSPHASVILANVSPNKSNEVELAKSFAQSNQVKFIDLNDYLSLNETGSITFKSKYLEQRLDKELSGEKVLMASTKNNIETGVYTAKLLNRTLKTDIDNIYMPGEIKKPQIKDFIGVANKINSKIIPPLTSVRSVQDKVYKHFVDLPRDVLISAAEKVQTKANAINLIQSIEKKENQLAHNISVIKEKNLGQKDRDF